MSPFRHAALVASLLLTLAACSAFNRHSGALPEARCRAAGASALLGKPMNETNADAARAQAGAARFRVTRYRAPVSGGDVDPLRLNIEVDEQGIIQRLRCG